MTETLTPRERTLAAAAHLVAIPFPLLGPVIVLAVFGRSSRYVAMHAWQEILGELLLKLAIFLILVVSLSHTIYTLVQHYQDGWRHFSIWPALLKSVAIWVALMVFGVLNTIGSCITAWKAYDGNWGGRRFIGKTARRLAGLPAAVPALTAT